VSYTSRLTFSASQVVVTGCPLTCARGIDLLAADHEGLGWLTRWGNRRKTRTPKTSMYWRTDGMLLRCHTQTAAANAMEEASCGAPPTRRRTSTNKARK